ncbi:MAG: amidohydrolase family protein [Phycisphaerales bacterium]|nr:amidohydrolase family protein [Phycisphaerales bacterium]
MDPTAADALRALRASTQGHLMLGEDRRIPVRYVVDRRRGVLVIPLPVEAAQVPEGQLLIPDEHDPVIAALVEIAHAPSPPAEDELRFEIYHGPPREGAWILAEVQAVRYHGEAFDGDEFRLTDELIEAEPELCRTLNADPEALRELCLRLAHARVEHPVAVGVDPDGIDVRAKFGTVRIEFDLPALPSERPASDSPASPRGAVLEPERARAIPTRTTRLPLREAHAHVYQLGRSRWSIDLADCSSPQEMLDFLADGVRAAAGSQACVFAFSARPESWIPPRWPTLAELDRATGRTPALAWCFDYHALMANSAMLALAGIEDDTPDPPGGIIERDDEWQLTGVVYERAAHIVWEALPEPSWGDRQRDLIEGQHRLEADFAEIHDLKSQPWLGPMLDGLLQYGHTLAARFVLFPMLEDIDALVKDREEWESEHVRLGGAKIFVDGTLNSRTAWMLEPYADGRPDSPRGTPMMTPRQIEDAVRKCDDLEVPLAAHAIGDAAVRAVLDAIERVRPRTPGFRIEHAEIIDPADIARFAKLRVIASVQPCHLLCDVEALNKALPHRLHRVLPLRDLIDAGCEPGETLLFGSDVPIVPADPDDSVRAATTRRREDMDPAHAIAPEQAITLEEAWECFRAAEPEDR